MCTSNTACNDRFWPSKGLALTTQGVPGSFYDWGEINRMPKDLDALVERLQNHDHPKFLESMPPSQRHTCSKLLKNILRMQGYNLGLVHQVITALTECYKETTRRTPSLGLDSDEENNDESGKTHGALCCIVIIKQNVYIFENDESLKPVSYL